MFHACMLAFAILSMLGRVGVLCSMFGSLCMPLGLDHLDAIYVGFGAYFDMP